MSLGQGERHGLLFRTVHEAGTGVSFGYRMEAGSSGGGLQLARPP